MALIEELIIVIIFEIAGLSLRKQVKRQHVDVARHIDSSNSLEPIQPKKKKGAGGIVLSILKKTIIGHLVMAIVGNRSERDVEMQQTRRQ
jgi:hypothetical protein